MAVVRGVFHDPLLQPAAAPVKGGAKKAALGNITNRAAVAGPLGAGTGPVKPGSSLSTAGSRSSSAAPRPAKALVYADDSENKGVQPRRQSQQPAGSDVLKPAPQQFVVASGPARAAGAAPAAAPKATGKSGDAKSGSTKRAALGAINVNATPAKPAAATGPVKPKAAPTPAPAPAPASAVPSSASQRVHVLPDDDGRPEVFGAEPEPEPHTVDLRATQTALNAIAAKHAVAGPTPAATAAADAYFSQFTDASLDAEIAAGLADDDISGFGALDV